MGCTKISVQYMNDDGTFAEEKLLSSKYYTIDVDIPNNKIVINKSNPAEYTLSSNGGKHFTDKYGNDTIRFDAVDKTGNECVLSFIITDDDAIFMYVGYEKAVYQYGCVR